MVDQVSDGVVTYICEHCLRGEQAVEGAKPLGIVIDTNGAGPYYCCSPRCLPKVCAKLLWETGRWRIRYNPPSGYDANGSEA